MFDFDLGIEVVTAAANVALSLVVLQYAPLEKLQNQQRVLIDDISHALQTPLTILKSALELFPTATADRQGRYFKTMTRSIDDISRLIRNLVELASIDTPPSTTTVETVDFSSLTKEVAEYVETICDGRAIRLQSMVDEQIFVEGNPAQLKEAVINILSNAVRYAKDSTMGEIVVILRKSGSASKLIISDNGIGIADDQLPHIFGRFYRAQDEQGSGLGLAITKRIIERHNGHIHIDSTLGQGTTVTIELPLTA